jgi:hypothetical protein
VVVDWGNIRQGVAVGNWLGSLVVGILFVVEVEGSTRLVAAVEGNNQECMRNSEVCWGCFAILRHRWFGVRKSTSPAEDRN